MTRARPIRVLAALALIALIGGGCSSERARSSNPTTRPAKDAQAVQFAQCMRDHGVKGFPDPDSSGQLTIDRVANGTSIDPSAPSFEQALAACKDLQPPGFTGHRRNADQQAAALEFAQCMRDHGVKDFPDPAPDAPLVDTNRIPSANRPGGMSAVNAGMRTCGRANAGRLGLQGK